MHEAEGAQIAAIRGLRWSTCLFKELLEANRIEVQAWGVVGSCKDDGNLLVSDYARPSGGLASLGLKFRILGSLLLENSF